MKNLIQVFEVCGLSNEQAKTVEEKQNALNTNDFQTFRDLLNSYPHPNLSDVEKSLNNPKNKVIISKVDYGGLDDVICAIINNIDKKATPEQAYPKLIPYLNAVLLYEENEKKHTHKGAIYFNIGQYLLKKGQVENGLYFIHRGLIEDDMKHIGVMHFPRVFSYQLIILDKKLNHPYVNDLIEFIFRSFYYLYKSFKVIQC